MYRMNFCSSFSFSFFPIKHLLYFLQCMYRQYEETNPIHFFFSISILKFHLGFNIASSNVALNRKQQVCILIRSLPHHSILKTARLLAAHFNPRLYAPSGRASTAVAIHTYVARAIASPSVVPLLPRHLTFYLSLFFNQYCLFYLQLRVPNLIHCNLQTFSLQKARFYLGSSPTPQPTCTVGSKSPALRTQVYPTMKKKNTDKICSDMRYFLVHVVPHRQSTQSNPSDQTILNRGTARLNLSR